MYTYEKTRKYKIIDNQKHFEKILTKESFESCLKSLINLPSLAHYDKILNMINIIGDSNDDDKISNELFQIVQDKENNIYTYYHFELGTHEILEQYEIDPTNFEFPQEIKSHYKIMLLLAGKYLVDW